jgi:hypothetical protein
MVNIMTTDHPASPKADSPSPSSDITVDVERESDGRSHIRIGSDQLKRAATLLRGESRFSLRDLLAGALTVFLATVIASAFQYVSWLNSLRIQAATDTAAAATAVYQEAAAEIGQRQYATSMFIAAVSDLVNRKDGTEVGLSKSAFDLDRQRVTSYYQMLTNWNDTYDRLITDVDYSIDRPIFRQAGMAVISSTETDKADCKHSLTEQVTKIGLDPHSLKAQFAVIAHCLGAIHTGFSAEKDTAILVRRATISAQVKDKYNHSLDNTWSMANDFRCYALRRIQFYNAEKEFTIINLRSIVERFANPWKKRATDHLSEDADKCERHSFLRSSRSVARYV